MTASWPSLSRADQLARLASLGLHRNEPEPVIICCNCKYAVRSNGSRVSTHLREKHGVSAIARRGLGLFLDSLKLAHPDKLELRQDGSSAHPHLAVFEGFGCKLCGFRSKGIRIILQRHLAKEHGMNRNTNNERYWSDYVEEGLKLQSWTPHGQRGYWTVRDNLTTSQPESRAPSISGVYHSGDWTPQEVSIEQQRRFDELHLLEEERIRTNAVLNHRYSQNDIQELDSALQRPFVKRTRWVELSRRDILVRLGQSPAKDICAFQLGTFHGEALTSSCDDERKLAQMSHALDLFFSRCEETVKYTDFSILRWLQSHRLYQPYGKPFELVTRTASARKYYMLWKRLVFFCFRFWRLGGVRSEALFQRRLSAHQEAQLRKVWYHPTAFSVLEPVAAVDQDLCNEKLGCAVDDDCLSDHGLSSDISYEECFDDDSAESDASDKHSLSPNVLDGVATPSEYYPAEDEVPRHCGKQAYDNILSDILASLSFFLVSEEFSNGRASSAKRHAECLCSADPLIREGALPHAEMIAPGFKVSPSRTN